MRPLTRRSPLTLALALAGTLAACSPAPEPPKRMPVQTLEVQRRRFEETVQTVATLDSEDEVQLATQASGRVQKLLVRPGESVHRGQLLLMLDQSQLRSRIAALRAAAERDQISFRRLDVLARAGAASALDRDERRAAAIASREELRAALADLSYRDLRAPIDGVIGDLQLKLGDVVSPGTPFTTLSRNDRLVARLELPGPLATRVQPGQRLELLADDGPQRLATGPLRLVAPRLEAASQALLVDAPIANPGGRLRDGQRLRARLLLGEEQRPAVPFTAVTRLAGQPFVFVVGRLEQLRRAPGRLELATLARLPGSTPVALQKPVRLGPLQDGFYPVLSGLEAGARVVSSGLLGLRHGSPIQLSAGG